MVESLLCELGFKYIKRLSRLLMPLDVAFCFVQGFTVSMHSPIFSGKNLQNSG